MSNPSKQRFVVTEGRLTDTLFDYHLAFSDRHYNPHALEKMAAALNRAFEAPVAAAQGTLSVEPNVDALVQAEQQAQIAQARSRALTLAHSNLTKPDAVVERARTYAEFMLTGSPTS